MRKCPYCGKESDEQVTVCTRCKAEFPRENAENNTPDEAEPTRLIKRKLKESE